MLLYFRCNNFRSINDEIELDLRAAPRLRRHKNHVRFPVEYAKNTRVLKSAVLYGANASGKSNILKAIDFAKKFVLSDEKANAPIRYDRFRITSEPKPTSSFYFEFAIAGNHCCYGFSVSHERVIEESFSLVIKDEQAEIFHREWNGNEYINTFSIEADNADLTSKFQYLMDFTHQNKLFAAEFFERGGHSQFKSVSVATSVNSIYLFFRYKLVVIFPDTRYGGLVDDLNNKSSCQYLNLFREFDTGIEGLKAVPVDVSGLPDEIKKEIENQTRDSKPSGIMINNKVHFLHYDENKEQADIFEVKSTHKTKDGKIIDFSIDDESDGTIRLLDLLPAALADVEDDFERTYIIDEFDRSLHPILAKMFIETFLSQDNNNQLIASTHQSHLLSNDILRRDEIWFVQKEWDHSSHLYSLDEYSPRFDKDLQSAYLNGAYGAIPFVMKNFKR